MEALVTEGAKGGGGWSDGCNIGGNSGDTSHGVKRSHAIKKFVSLAFEVLQI